MSDANPALILYGFGSVDEPGDPFALLDVGPFAHKLEAWLRLAALPYRKRLGDIRKAPRGKLPYVELAGQVLGDSQDVIDRLAREGLADLDGWLSTRQRAISTALRSMLEEDLYFIMLYMRWVPDSAWNEYAPVLRELIARAGAPKPIAGLIARFARRGVLGSLHGQGTSRRSPQQLIERAETRLDALVELAEPNAAWLLGDRPCTLDAVAHAFIAGMRWPRVPTPLAGLIEARPTLLEWFARADAVVRARGPLPET